jgi:hypothetical protein
MNPTDFAIQTVQQGLRTSEGRSQTFPTIHESAGYISHILYDTVPLAASSVNSPDRFFTVPMGSTQNGLQKNDVHTNMREGSKLPAGQNVLVTGLSIAWILPTALRLPTILEAIDTILRNSRLRLVVPPREYEIEIPGSLLCAPKGLYTAGVATFPVLVGNETAPMMYNFGIEVPLTGVNSAPVNFYVEHMISDDYGDITVLIPGGTATPLNNVRRQIRLHGALERPT